MNNTVKEIIKALEGRLNDVAYVQEHTSDWLEKRKALEAGHALYVAYDEACKIAGIRYECGRSIRDGKECDTYTAVYPTETATETQTETNTNGGNSQDSNRVYCPALGGWIMHYDACRGGCEYDSETDTCKLYRNNTQKGGDA